MLQGTRLRLGSSLAVAIGVTGTCAVLVFAATGSAASTADPVNTKSPQISGTARDNETLTASKGSWSSSKDLDFAYDWRRCDDNGNNCTSTGKTGTQYTVTSNDIGHRLRVAVTATYHDGSPGSTTATSDKTDVVAAAGTKPTSKTVPTISGTAQDNQKLTASPGTWSGTTPITYTYLWQRCDANGNACSSLEKTGQVYTVVSADVGHRLRVSVTAKNSVGSASAVSAPTNVTVAAGTGPANAAAPTIVGIAQQGQTLSATSGTWTGTTPLTFTYQWLRCDSGGNACVVVPGATATAYKVTSPDVGHRVRVAVSAKNSLSTSTALSAPTAVVSGISVGGGPAVPIAGVSLPNRLIIDDVKFTPPTIGSRGAALIGRFRVVDSTGHPVQGALVYAIGVPANRVTAPPETTTDSNGWAQLVYQPLRGLPLRRGALLTIFVRARKAGENPLGGVSTRRLVSIRVSPS